MEKQINHLNIDKFQMLYKIKKHISIKYFYNPTSFISVFDDRLE